MPRKRPITLLSLLANTERQLREIDQYLTDCASYNDNRGRDNPIDPDPDGEVARSRRWLVSLANQLRERISG